MGSGIRDLKWEYQKPLQDVKVISDIEQNFNISIPNELREYILNYNSGNPSINIFDSQKSKENLFGALISYNKSDPFNIYLVINILRKSGNKNLLPFADDGCGNFICIDMSTQKIVYFLHETDKIEFIANSFTEFIGSLYEIEDEPEDKEKNNVFSFLKNIFKKIKGKK